MTDAVKVFVSYSHQDAEYLKYDSLLGFLKGLEKDGVEFWDDRRIRPGELWDEVIKTNLEEARIALVLVSQFFLDSAYCQNVEIEHCLARKTHLFPIILSPCDWQRHDWLSRRQFLPGGDQNHRGTLHRTRSPQAVVSGDSRAVAGAGRTGAKAGTATATAGPAGISRFPPQAPLCRQGQDRRVRPSRR